MSKKIILLTSRKLYHQTEELANALMKEMEYSQSLEDRNQRLMEENMKLDDKISKLYDELEELHNSYMQLMDSNRALEFVNDVLEGDLEHYRHIYGSLDDEEL